MKPKLRIGILGTRGIPNNYGGFEAFAERFSANLAARGHHVSVYCAHNQPFRNETLNGVRLWYRHNPERRMGTAGQFIYDLNCNLHARKQPFDVILHLGYTSDSVWKSLWSKSAKHITNMDGLEWQRSKYIPAVQRFLHKAEKWAATGSDLLIADAAGIKQYLGLHYKTPVKHIAYGADIPEYFDPMVTGQFNVVPYGYDLLVARMAPENNIEIAAEAVLKSNTQVPLLIFGNATGYGKMVADKHRNARNIIFQQANYDPQILNALRHFSRYYLHGHSAGGTNPSLLEAMACGCRVLAHDNVFNRGVLGDNAGFFRDAEQLAFLLAQPRIPENFRKYTENNLNSIRINYNWDFITDEYEDAFYQVLGL